MLVFDGEGAADFAADRAGCIFAGFEILDFGAFEACFCDVFAALAGAVLIEGRDFDNGLAGDFAGAFAEGFATDFADALVD